MDEQELRRRLSQYSFYHVIQLTPTLRTPGIERHMRSQEKVLNLLRGLDFAHKKVLDVGCRDGLYSFEAEKRGAAEIIGIDNDLSHGAEDLLIPWFRSRVRMVEMNLFALTPATFGLFDAVIFAGVLYHLRFPFLGLDILREVLVDGGTLLLESAIFVDDNRHALLHCPSTEDTPYDPTSVSFFNMKGLIDTLSMFGFQVEKYEVEGGLAPDASRERLPIDRVAVLCRRHKAGEKEEAASAFFRYWKSLHQRHSTGLAV